VTACCLPQSPAPRAPPSRGVFFEIAAAPLASFQHGPCECTLRFCVVFAFNSSSRLFALYAPAEKV